MHTHTLPSRGVSWAWTTWKLNIHLFPKEKIPASHIIFIILSLISLRISEDFVWTECHTVDCESFIMSFLKSLPFNLYPREPVGRKNCLQYSSSFILSRCGPSFERATSSEWKNVLGLDIILVYNSCFFQFLCNLKGKRRGLSRRRRGTACVLWVAWRG